MEIDFAQYTYHKAMKNKKLASKDKIAIVMEFLETDIKMADLCRKYDIQPGEFSKWKTQFIEGGKKAIESRGVSDLLRHKRETEKLKTIIDEQNIVIEEFKKSLKVWRE